MIESLAMAQLMAQNQCAIDAGIRPGVPGWLPWWERATNAQLAAGIARERRALRFCRGRAADLYPHLAAHIRALESYQAGTGYVINTRVNSPTTSRPLWLGIESI